MKKILAAAGLATAMAVGSAIPASAAPEPAFGPTQDSIVERSVGPHDPPPPCLLDRPYWDWHGVHLRNICGWPVSVRVFWGGALPSACIHLAAFGGKADVHVSSLAVWYSDRSQLALC